MITAERYHDISCGHRVYGQGGKCEHLHGHNYRIHFTITPHVHPENQTGLDDVGRVLDFSVMKEKFCMWLERTWDHKFLVWEKDPWADHLWQIDRKGTVLTPFNPTAENMALHLLHTVGPKELGGIGCTLIKVRVEETRKCSASAELFV